MPEPDMSWVAPQETSTPRGGRPGRVATILVGLTAAPLLAYASVRIVGQAWYDCGVGGAGGRFSLVFGVLPGLTLAGLVLYGVSIRILGRHWRPLAVAVGLAAIVALCYLYIGANATPADYPGDSDVCLPGNVPPWWPSWLP